MAHHKDALKRIRQNEKRQERNRSIRSFYRKRMRNVRQAIAAKDVAQAQAALPLALSAIDRAVAKNVLHRNTAARYKSRLARAVAALATSNPPA
ncbi:MAG: 30S ribosomal protein S20 [candidate division WOR-3 bacterium]